MVITWAVIKTSLAVTLYSKRWQIVFTNWKMKPSPVSSPSLWTAPAAVPHWGTCHWVLVQDFRWLPLQWLKLNLGVTTGGSILLIGTVVLDVKTHSCIILWIITWTIWLVWEHLVFVYFLLATENSKYWYVGMGTDYCFEMRMICKLSIPSVIRLGVSQFISANICFWQSLETLMWNSCVYTAGKLQ